MDSGATVSIGERRFFIESTLRPCHTRIQCANGKFMTCTLRGTMVVEIGGKKIMIENALCIDGVANLLSVNQLVNKGYILVFDVESVGIFASKNDVLVNEPFMLLKRKIGEKLWVVNQPVKALMQDQKPFDRQTKVEKLAFAMFTKMFTEEDLVTMHNKVAHCSLPLLKILFPSQLEKVYKLPPCHACLSMQFKKKYKKTTDYTNEGLGELVAMTQDQDVQKEIYWKYLGGNVVKEVKGVSKIVTKDLSKKVQPLEEDVLDSQTIRQKDEKAFLGNPKDIPRGYGRLMQTDTKSITKPSIRGYNYFHVVLDRDSKLCEVYLSETKDELERHLKEFMRKFYNQHRRFPPFWKFDQGGENYSHAMVNFMNSCGTQVLYTGTQDHNSNAHAERKICVLWDAVMKTLAHTNVPFPYWCYCLEYITTVQNHLPTRALMGKIPQQVAKKVSLMHLLLVWGSGVWFSRPENKDFETRRCFGAVLGFSKLKMTYCVLDIETRDIIDTRNVVSIPNNFPFRDAYSVPASVIRYNYDNWPSFMPIEKVSMDKEKMLLKLAPKDGENSLENKQDQIFPQVTPVKVSDVKEEKVERNVSESNMMSPISNHHSTFISPMTNYSGRGSPELDNKHETSGGMSTTYDLHKDLSGNSTTFVLPKDRDLDDSESTDKKFQSSEDPLNLSNVNPDQEAKIRKLRVEKFKVNGQRSEMNKEQKERAKKLASSRTSKPKKVVASLDLQDKIPIPKILPERPKPGEKIKMWEPKKILDIRDSIMGSTRGYDLKIDWGLDEQGKAYEDSWEPSNNITKEARFLFNRFKETNTFKDYILKKNDGKVEVPPPKKKKVRWTYETKKDESPVKDVKVENPTSKTRSGKMYGKIWKRDDAKAYTINVPVGTIWNKLKLPKGDQDESPEDFAKSNFGEYFGQVPSYLDKEQQDKVFAAFVQADLDELTEVDSYEDYTLGLGKHSSKNIRIKCNHRFIGIYDGVCVSRHIQKAQTR